MDLAAKKLINGETIFKVDNWMLYAGGMSFPIWPWQMVNSKTLMKPKTYSAVLVPIQTEYLGIILNMAWGLERILAPASTLLVFSALSKELGTGDRKRLGVVLRVMNKFYGTPQASGKLLSEVKAFNAAMSVLHGTK